MPLRSALASRLAALTLLVTLAGCVSTPTFAPAAGVRASAVARLRSARPSPLRWPASHRGERDDGQAGNGRAAILDAARGYVPLIEVDVRTGSDGVLFLFHDRVVDDGPCAGREATSLSAAEVAAQGLLTLEAALRLVEGTGAALQLDLKAESPAQLEAVVHLARGVGVAERIVVQCQGWPSFAHLRARFPEVAALRRCRSLEQVREALPLRPELVQIDEDWATPALIDEIHAAGSRVLVKALGSLDDEDAWRALFARGVDVLLTDHAVGMIRELELPVD
ncbi:MAG: hypothetical protein R3F62_07065 [Planctomycetota bacterium]